MHTGNRQCGAMPGCVRTLGRVRKLAQAIEMRPDIDWEAIAACGGGRSCFDQVVGLADGRLGWSCTPWRPVNEATALIERFGGIEIAGGFTVEEILLTGRMPGKPFFTSTVKGQRLLDDVLKPGGKPIGKRRTGGSIRVVQGGDEAAWDLFAKLASGGTIVSHSTYRGILVKLPGGGTVGLRESTRHGSLSIYPFQINPIQRIHFEH